MKANTFVRLAMLAAAVSGAGCAALGDANTTVSEQASGEVSLFTATDTPRIVADSDTAAVELGVRFRADVAGTITGVRFHKSSANTGTHVGHLWTSRGTLLAAVTFSNETSSGWQTARFATPVAIRAGVTYVASYHTRVGRYSATNDAFASAGLDRPPLHALRDGEDGRNGVYRYGASGFPTNTWRASNYFVDVVFQPAGTSSSDAGAATDASTPSDAGTPGTDAAAPSDAGTTITDSGSPGATQCVGAMHTPGGPDGMGGCWPGPHNTGYPHGLPGDARRPVTLTTYTGPTTIRECGVVIDSKIVNDTILIEAGNGTRSRNTPCVTIRNSLVRGVIFAESSTSGPTLVEDTEVAPPDLPWWENIGRSNIFVYRVNSHGGEGVIKCDDNCEARDNWVHGMRLGGQYHYNAFGGNGTNGFVIDHNYATCGDWESIASPGSDAGCSAVIGFYGDFAPIQNVTVTRNHLASTFGVAGTNTEAGYCLNQGYYPGKPYPNPSNFTFTNNVFGRGQSNKCGAYGAVNTWLSGSGNVYSNNVYDDGAVVPPG